MNQARKIVADAGPLIGLARIQSLHLVTSLFSEVLVPSEVEQECCRDLSLPGAVLVRAAIDERELLLKGVSEKRVIAFPPGLGPGESAAIALAHQMQAPVLMDDRMGRRTASGHGIAVVGLGGLLLQAKKRGLVPSLNPLLAQLKDQSYRISSTLVQELLRRAGEA